MSDAIVWVIFGSLVLNVVLTVVLLIRSFMRYDRASDILQSELKQGREENNKAARELREEVTGSLTGLATIQQTQLEKMTSKLDELVESNQSGMNRIRDTLDTRVKELQDGNDKKLEEMRKTVDEKLHDTLEKRLGESFKLVGDRLEAVQSGLGEMRSLASGVGDLKRVLTNVKVRGTWAEIQLGALLEQILAPGQYEKNVKTNPLSREVVEYAVKLPGQGHEGDPCVWLPIDSKFPQEDYVRLQEAAERGDPEAVTAATDALGRVVKIAAQDIRDKYLSPPNTTDIAIMFLPTEGLYAEVLRQQSVVEYVQVQCRVVIAGPTTLAAILNSLRMGFQSLAIEQRAVEVRRILSAVKIEFSKFGGVIEKVKKQLETASKTIDQTGIRTRAMERHLRSVEEIPTTEAAQILHLSEAGIEEATEDESEAEDNPF